MMRCCWKATWWALSSNINFSHSKYDSYFIDKSLGLNLTTNSLCTSNSSAQPGPRPCQVPSLRCWSKTRWDPASVGEDEGHVTSRRHWWHCCSLEVQRQPQGEKKRWGLRAYEPPIMGYRMIYIVMYIIYMYVSYIYIGINLIDYSGQYWDI